MVNDWEMTPWACRAGEVVLRECWRVGLVSCRVLLCASLLILPRSFAFPSKAGSRNHPPPLSPLLVQLRTVSKMTAYGELGDDAMGMQGRRASLAGVLAGGVGVRANGVTSLIVTTGERRGSLGVGFENMMRSWVMK